MLEFNTLSNPCVQGIPEHVAIRQCYFCDHVNPENHNCDKNMQFIDTPGLPHICPRFLHEKNTSVYRMIRKMLKCKRCTSEMESPCTDNGVTINGVKCWPICDDCLKIMRDYMECK